MIAAAPPDPAIREATVFHTRDHAHRHPPGVEDPFMEGRQGTVVEFVDARISAFTEMGFTAEQAEAALLETHNDVNEALSLLLERRVE